MNQVHVAIDFGGTSTDVLVIGQDKSKQLCSYPSARFPATPEGVANLLSGLKLEDNQITDLITTGGKSRFLPPTISSLTQTNIDEIAAIGQGGLSSAGLAEALVVSLGTGTAIVWARPDAFEHIGGTGLGGGTILGLGNLLCQTTSFRELEKLASHGNASNLDLSVRDIIGGDIGIIPAKHTAANFAKAACEQTKHCAKQDIAAALFALVGQTVARLAITLASGRPIVIIGRVIQSPYMQNIFRQIGELFSGQFIFPADPCYGVATGAYELAIHNLPLASAPAGLL